MKPGTVGKIKNFSTYNGVRCRVVSHTQKPHLNIVTVELLESRLLLNKGSRVILQVDQFQEGGK